MWSVTCHPCILASSKQGRLCLPLGKAWWCCHPRLPSTPLATFCNRNKSVFSLRTRKVSARSNVLASGPTRRLQAGGGQVRARNVNGETRVDKPTNTVVTSTAQDPSGVTTSCWGRFGKRCPRHLSWLGQALLWQRWPPQVLHSRVRLLVGIFTGWAAVPVRASDRGSAVARVGTWLHPPARAPLWLTHSCLLWSLAMT